MTKAISGLFGGGGGSSGAPVPRTLDVSAGGRTLTTKNTAPGAFRTELTNTGSAAQSAEASRFPRILGDIDALRATLTPGFSDLRAASSRAIDRSRNTAIGNLRQTLSQRRVLGSSFGEQALVSAEREFAEAQSASQAQSFLAELQANQQILAHESAQVNQALQLELQELGIATGQNAELARLNTEVAKFNADMDARESAAGAGGLGSLLNTGLGFAALGGAFGGGGAASTSVTGEGGVFDGGGGLASAGGSSRIGSLLGTGLGFAFGGPAGAAIGGSLGGSLGGGGAGFGGSIFGSGPRSTSEGVVPRGDTFLSGLVGGIRGLGVQ